MSHTSSPPVRQRRSIITEGPQGRPSRPAQLPAANPPVKGTHPARPPWFRQARTEANPQQGHYQISAAVGASGRAARSKGTFGSEQRWYQPTPASDEAAALTHQALAAAAAEQELQNAHCLLNSSPVARSKSVPRCTFGSELRWWESNEASSRSLRVAEAETHHHQETLSPSDFAYANGATKKLEAYPAGQVGCPDHHSMPGRSPTSEVQWRANAAAGQPRLQGAATAAAAASASSSAPGAAAATHIRQRFISADKGLRQAQPLVSTEQAWWESDPSPSPDSTLQRIQQKHARIQSLAAMIKQRPISEQTHTVKSTFGSETRWWEKSSAYDDASASGRSCDLQRGASSRASSPDGAHKLQRMSHDSGARETHPVFRGRSTFGSEARWWEPKGNPAPAAVAMQDTAVVVQSSARSLSVMSSDRAVPRSTLGAADSWWAHSQDRHGPLAPGGRTPGSTSHVAQSLSPPKRQLGQFPNITTASVPQRRSQRLHTHPWTAGLPLPKEAGLQQESMGLSGGSARPHRTSVGGSKSSINPIHTPSRQSRGSITAGTTPVRQSRGSISEQSSMRRSRDSVASIGIERARSGSPDGSVKGGRQLTRTISSRSELQEELRYR